MTQNFEISKIKFSKKSFEINMRMRMDAYDRVCWRMRMWSTTYATTYAYADIRDYTRPYGYAYEMLKIRCVHCIPISTCEGERCFTVLKLIKSFLRTTMKNERLSDLAILKIANDVSINYEDIINAFANVWNRQLAFY